MKVRKIPGRAGILIPDRARSGLRARNRRAEKTRARNLRAVGHAFESRSCLFFIFQFENILQSNSKFSSSYGR